MRVLGRLPGFLPRAISYCHLCGGDLEPILISIHVNEVGQKVKINKMPLFELNFSYSTADCAHTVNRLGLCQELKKLCF